MKPSRLPSRPQLEILKFLWRWKMANTMALKTHLAPTKSFWKFYQRLRQLVHEGYICEAMDAGFGTTVWVLTKKGFIFLYGRSDLLEQNRYKVQSMNHDFWNTAFHLGNFVFGIPHNVEIVTEQEINAKKLEILPDWIPQSKDHIPDGLTRIKNGDYSSVLAFETETSQKTSGRYDEILYFLDKYPQLSMVFWLCENYRVISKITQQVIDFNRSNASKHNFIVLSDFQKLGWKSPILWGGKANMTIEQVITEIGGNSLVNTPVNKLVTTEQPNAIEIFQSVIKSPRGLKC